MTQFFKYFLLTIFISHLPANAASDDFEAYNPVRLNNQLWKSLDMCCNHSISFVRGNSGSIFSNVRSGNQAIKLTLKRDDAQINNGIRSELRAHSEPAAGGRSWYKFSIKFPPNWIIDPNSHETIAQWQSPPDADLGENWRSPPLSFVVKGNKLALESRSDNRAVMQKNVPQTKKDVWETPLQPILGRWQDFAISIDWSHEDDGHIALWHNDKKQGIFKGANAYNDQNPPYFKLGLYKWGWKSSKTRSLAHTRELYIDNVSMGSW